MNRIDSFTPPYLDATSSPLVDFPEFNPVFYQLCDVLIKRKSESENLSTFENAVFPEEWLESELFSSKWEEPFPNTLLFRCLNYAAVNHQEQFLQLLLEKGVDPARLRLDPLLAEKLFVLFGTVIEDKNKQKERFFAARVLLDYLEERCASSEKHRHFLFQTGIDLLFSEQIIGGYEKEIKVRYAKRYIQYAIPLAETYFADIAVPEDKRDLFLQEAVCCGAMRLLRRLIEQDPSCLLSTDGSNNLLHLAILSRQEAVFFFLLERAPQLADQKSFRLSIYSGNETAFNSLVSTKSQEELNDSANFSLSIYSVNYLRKLICLGASVDLQEGKWTHFMIALSMMNCSKTREEVEEFGHFVLDTQIPQSLKEQRQKELTGWLRWVFSKNIPDMIYRIRSCSSTVFWSGSYGGESTQERYDKRFRKNVAGAVFIIKSGHGFKPLLSFLSAKRKRMAYLEKQWKEGFGEFRTRAENDWCTPLSGSRYEIYFDKIRQKIDAGTAKIGFKFPSLFEKTRGVFVQIIGTIDGKPIHLTKIEKNERFNGFEWKHTFCNESVKVLGYVERLYDEVVAERLPRREDPEYRRSAQALTRKIIHIHWWMAHATPLLRGSAAVTDMLVRSLFVYKEIEITPWLPGAIADCEALIEGDPDQFCLTYPSLMEPGYDEAFLPLDELSISHS